MSKTAARITSIIFTLFILTLPVFSEDPPPQPEITEIPDSPQQTGKLEFGMFLGLGVTVFDGDTYQRLSLSPEFAVNKLGIAFDLTFHFKFEDSNLKFRKEDWVPSEVTARNVIGLYLGKFRYIRWAQKGDPLYFKFGSIDNGTLGNGFIMGNYNNTLFLPQTRIFGLTFDLDGKLFDFPFIGFNCLLVILHQ